jgi:hypothetical protein
MAPNRKCSKCERAAVVISTASHQPAPTAGAAQCYSMFPLVLIESDSLMTGGEEKKASRQDCSVWVSAQLEKIKRR